MRSCNIDLTPFEWNLMECLWYRSPRTGRQAIDYMSAHYEWSRSTTLTMLRRMSEKGFINCVTENGLMTYYPAIERDDAAKVQTDNFLDRVYNGSLSMMLSAMTKKQDLSGEEIAQLYAILKEAEEAKENN